VLVGVIISESAGTDDVGFCVVAVIGIRGSLVPDSAVLAAFVVDESSDAGGAPVDGVSVLNVDVGLKVDVELEVDVDTELVTLEDPPDVGMIIVIVEVRPPPVPTSPKVEEAAGGSSLVVVAATGTARASRA